MVPMIYVFLFIATTSAKDVVPTNNMNISVNTTFVSGIYHVPDGISIVESNVILDMNNATLIGTNYQNVGITVLPNLKNIQILNGNIHRYYYGIKVDNSSNILIKNNNISNNYVDPQAFNSTGPPPWLDINVKPTDYGDRTNLGGGLWMSYVDRADIINNTATNQENGFDLFYITNSNLLYNDCSFNSGWGLHFYKSFFNNISFNIANNCTRVGPNKYYTCDTAGILLNCECHHNYIGSNEFRYGGDGIFMSGFPRDKKNECCPSNSNIVADNDCTGSPNNAIESTFAQNNTFVGNTLNDSNYGMWLGYSHNNNQIINNIIARAATAGIAVEHGRDNIIKGNTIVDGTQGCDGIHLWTDLQIHFPESQYECLDIPNQQYSHNYTIFDNYVGLNYGVQINLVNTTNSTIYNNIVLGGCGMNAEDIEFNVGNNWNVTARKETNIIGGPYIGGNYWFDYNSENCGNDFGCDPYNDNGLMSDDGDLLPLLLPNNDNKTRIYSHKCN